VEALEIAPRYRLAAAGREAAEDERLSLLEQLYDPVSRRRRAFVEPGWRCLEVGAGRGSMAVWLAEQVGPGGQVVVTDIDTRYLQQVDVPNLEVLQHSIVDDSLDVLGPGSFDLVCSRLTLFHLVGRQEVAIRQMPVPASWWVADRRGRRLGHSRSNRSYAPALRRLPARLAKRRLVDFSRLRQGVWAKAAGAV
jgi:SAM-dependent methyltransferase